MSSLLHGERRWRGVADGRRSVKTKTLTGLVTLVVLLAGCTHCKRTYIQVVDASSREPLASAKVTTSLYNPAHLDSHRTHIKEVLTRSNGLAVVRMPMCSTRGAPVAYLYEGGRCVGRADPNADVGPELLVEKEGYIGSALYRSNDAWRYEDSSPESPFVVTLTRNRTEPDGAANRSQPVRSDTNQPSAAAGSGR
jgi:hypothetical protein